MPKSGHSTGGRLDLLTEIIIADRGVVNPKNFADVLYGRPLMMFSLSSRACGLSSALDPKL